MRRFFMRVMDREAFVGCVPRTSLPIPLNDTLVGEETK